VMPKESRKSTMMSKKTVQCGHGTGGQSGHAYTNWVSTASWFKCDPGSFDVFQAALELRRWHCNCSTDLDFVWE
jgi:hypothetical protein